DEIHGSILEQIAKIVELVYLKYMRAKITYEGMQRIERYFVPEEALREALLNALCHKQYQSGVPIQISVYEDKLYIANCGCLPENWTLENLMNKHASSPYNPNIAHVFRSEERRVGKEGRARWWAEHGDDKTTYPSKDMGR